MIRFSWVLAAGLGAATAGGQVASGKPAADLNAELQSSGVEDVLQAVSPVSDDVAWISGHAGSIVRTLDGGRAWTRVPAPGGDTLQFRDVHAFSGAAAVVMSSGEGGLSRIYRTDDGGERWTQGFHMEEAAGFLDCLDFWDDERGFAYGDAVDGRLYILLTHDGGRSWTGADPERAPGAQAGEGGFAASGTCARAGPGGRGWIATGAGTAGRLLSTDDHGASWQDTEVPMARGGLAGLFTIAMGETSPLMLLGGDLEAQDRIVANAAVPADDRGPPGPWTSTVRPAPVAGAVYGSAVSRVEGGAALIVAFAPTASAFTDDDGATWRELAGVSAWAGAFSPSGRVGWAAGSEGRIWRLTPVP